MVRELGFEMKAQPSNRMKTEEELAEEAQERLRGLEVGDGAGAVGKAVAPSCVALGSFGEMEVCYFISGTFRGYFKFMSILLLYLFSHYESKKRQYTDKTWTFLLIPYLQTSTAQSSSPPPEAFWAPLH